MAGQAQGGRPADHLACPASSVGSAAEWRRGRQGQCALETGKEGRADGGRECEREEVPNSPLTTGLASRPSSSAAPRGSSLAPKWLQPKPCLNDVQPSAELQPLCSVGLEFAAHERDSARPESVCVQVAHLFGEEEGQPTPVFGGCLNMYGVK